MLHCCRERLLSGLASVSKKTRDMSELRGFDGSLSIAQVVRADLLFLRRAFKGRFLLIDQEWGLLGRDILNHVALVFDGQKLVWEEDPRSV